MLQNSSFNDMRPIFSKVAYFDELAEDGEIAQTRSRGIPLSAQEDLEGQNPKPNNSACSSTR